MNRLHQRGDVDVAVKACYDVRESSAFWHKLALHSQLTEDTDSDNFAEMPQWLSTHPNHESRAKKLDDMIPAVSIVNQFLLRKRHSDLSCFFLLLFG